MCIAIFARTERKDSGKLLSRLTSTFAHLIERHLSGRWMKEAAQPVNDWPSTLFLRAVLEIASLDVCKLIGEECSMQRNPEGVQVLLALNSGRRKLRHGLLLL